MSSTIVTIILIAGLGIGAYFVYQNRCNWIPSMFPGDCNKSSTRVDPSTVTNVTAVPVNITKPSGKVVPKNKYVVTHTDSSTGTSITEQLAYNPQHKTTACDGNGACPPGFIVAKNDQGCFCHWGNGISAFARAMSAMTVTGGRMSIN